MEKILKSITDIIDQIDWKKKTKQTNKLELALNVWKARYLTYYGKIPVIKTFDISQLLHCASSMHVPDYVIREENKMLFQFIGSFQKKKKLKEQRLRDTWNMVV